MSPCTPWMLCHEIAWTMVNDAIHTDTLPDDVGPSDTSAWRTLTIVSLIVLLTAVAYGPALRGDFIWDDNEYVRDNTLLRSLEGLQQIWLVPSATPQYHPLVFTTFWFEYHLWGLQPLGYHVVNVMLHALDSILVWLVLTRLAVPGALLAAAVFALHPMHVESVAWITERKDVLSAAFYLFTLLAWLRFLEDRRPASYATALVAFSCTLLSKSVLCTLPLIALLLTWWRAPGLWRQAVLWMLPFFVLSGAVGVLTMWREYQHGNPPLALSALDRLAIAGSALSFYALTLVWPVRLTAIYSQWALPAITAIGTVLAFGWAVTLGLLYRLRLRLGAGPFVAVAAFVITMSPMLGVVDNNFMRLSYVANHFVYVASISLIALATAALTVATRRMLPAGSPAATGLAAVGVTGLAVLTWQNAGIYRNAEVFWKDNIAKNAASWMGHNGLAGALARQGRLDEAGHHLEAAIAIKPDYAVAYNHWGIILDAQGQLDAALERYEAAIRINPTLADVHNNMGTVLFRQGRLDEARAHFQTAVELRPNYAEAYNHLGLVAARSGDAHGAITYFQEALRIRPDYPAAQRNLEQAQGALQ